MTKLNEKLAVLASHSVQAEFDAKGLKDKYLKLGAHHFKAITTKKPEDHEAYHKAAKELTEDLNKSEKESPNRKSFHQNMHNAIRAMNSFHPKKGEK